ncbi:hypothetical protein DINM_002488 [Dirofilaria immitis]|nr:hypothetical protein [Dirofilaria immitis]
MGQSSVSDYNTRIIRMQRIDVGRNVADMKILLVDLCRTMCSYCQCGKDINEALENYLQTKKGGSPENIRDDVTFNDKVIRTVASISGAGFCPTDMDVVDQINALFPTEQSLSQLDSVMHSVEDEIVGLDCQLAKLVETHGTAGAEGNRALHEAHASMGDLEERVHAVCLKTQSSENVVQEMTRDIKQLDVAKRNLISSLKALHHLHILLTGVYSLVTGCSECLTTFWPLYGNGTYQNVAEQLERLKQQLAIQLVVDLKHSFQTGVLNSSVTDMCRVASSLDSTIREDFCKWFIEHQLSEYTVLYGESESIAWIDKIDLRYRWFVQKLTEFEKTGVMKVFPVDWDMGRRLTSGYCDLTREMLERMMSRRWLELDYKVLAHAINHTIMFENLLCKRFPAKGTYNFEKIRSGIERPTRETASHAYPLPSSADMFLLLKKIIAESTKLSSNPNALLRDETVVRLTVDQQFLHASIDLNQEMELFYSISNSALSVLVQDVESTCDAALQAMTVDIIRNAFSWNGVESVGDESLYISSIRSHLRSSVPLIRDFFIDRRKYFAHFCLKLATQLVNKFLGALFRCRPVSVAGAEQLLLDAHALKTFYYLCQRLFGVTKVLEMKALKRQEQTSIIQLYKSRIEGQTAAIGHLAVQSSAISTLESIGDSSMRRLEQLVKKKA